MNAEQIKRIKSSIVPTKKLITGTTPNSLSNKICENINCYAYALGIMWNGNEVYFRPGFTEKSIDDQDDRDILNDSDIFMKGICSDLENLRISYRQIDLDGEKSLEDGEYLIKVFFSKTYGIFPNSEFHFVRFDKHTNIWYHKFGWFEQPKVVNDFSYDRVKYKDSEQSEPDGFFDLDGVTNLEPLGYFVIKEK